MEKLRAALSPDVCTLKFKAFYFLYMFGTASMPLYLPVYFRSVGMNAVQTGTLTALWPFMRGISGPIFGAIADKTRRHKMILMLSLVIVLCFYTSLSFITIVQQRGQEMCEGNSSNVPIGRPFVKEPDLVDLPANCNGSNDAILSNTAIFISILSIVLVADFFDGSILPIITASVVNEFGRAAFGRQRMFGALGFGLGSFLTGVAMEKTSRISYIAGSPPSGQPNYLTAFMIYFGVNVLELIVVWCKLEIVHEENAKSPSLRGHFQALLTDWRSVLLIIVIFIFGSTGGVIILYLFWFLQDLGAPQSLLGLAYATMSAAEVAVFPFAGDLIDRCSHVGVLAISLVCLIVRFVAYSVVKNPWYVLLIEPLHGFTYAAMWATCVSLASHIAPPEIQATIQGVMFGVHSGLGWGVGALLGGVVYGAYGPRNLFRGCAGLCGLGLILLAVLYRTSPVEGGLGSSPQDPEVGQVSSRDEYTLIPLEDDDIKE